jgi:hypothetical protein
VGSGMVQARRRCGSVGSGTTMRAGGFGDDGVGFREVNDGMSSGEVDDGAGSKVSAGNFGSLATSSENLWGLGFQTVAQRFI